MLYFDEYIVGQNMGDTKWDKDCVDRNVLTMERENEEDEKFETNPKKDVIKRVSFTIFIVSINIRSEPLYYDVINEVPIYH